MIASAQQDRQLSEIVAAERPRLLNFVRRRVANEADVEELVQDVFAELVEANRLLMPISYVTGWLFQVARNRIIDLFRKKRPVNFSDAAFTAMRASRSSWRFCCPRRMRGLTRFTCAACSSRNWKRRWTSCRKRNATCLWRTSWKGAAFASWRRRPVCH